jgi:hypothetical protein
MLLTRALPTKNVPKDCSYPGAKLVPTVATLSQICQKGRQQLEKNWQNISQSSLAINQALNKILNIQQRVAKKAQWQLFLNT